MEAESKREYYIALYDIYGGLLTDKQQEYFEDYYFLDLSLSEIAENHEISRNGVHDQIKRVINALINYENVLKLYQKYGKIEDTVKDEELKSLIFSILKE